MWIMLKMLILEYTLIKDLFIFISEVFQTSLTIGKSFIFNFKHFMFIECVEETKLSFVCLLFFII